jgi:hypothetical protein
MGDGPPVALYFFAALVVGLVLLAIYRRREFVAAKLRSAFFALGGFALVILIARRYTTDGTKILLAALLAEVLIIFYTRPHRSRYIPRSEKRKAIERYERKTGQRYNPRRHHIDHVVPHARGGSNKADNLRVLDSERNLAKSDRSPWWDVFGR